MKRLAFLAVLAGCQPPAATVQPTLPPPEALPTPTKVGDATPEPPPPPDRAPWRATPPAAPPLGAFVPPEVRRLTLAGGTPLYVVENHALPLVTTVLVVKAGSASAKPGLASLAANMLDEGAGKLKALEVADRLGRLGAALSVNVTVDASNLRVDALKENLGATLDLFADVVLRPSFDAVELERVKGLVAVDIARARDDGGTAAWWILDRVLYGDGHPYALPPIGVEAGVRALTRDDVVAFHRAAYVPARSAFVVVGDVTPEEAKAALDARFASWRIAPGAAAAPAVPAAPPATRRVVVVDRPEADQVDVAVGAPGPSRLDPDWYAAAVLNEALGGMFSSRLNLDLREAKGWTYGAYSMFADTVGPGELLAGASVKPERGVAGAARIVELLGEVAARPVAGDELARAKDSATLGLAARFETNGAIAYTVGEVFLFDLPDDYWRSYAARIQAVSPADVAGVASRWLVPAKVTVVLVGKAALILPALAEHDLGAVERRLLTGEAAK